MDTSYLLEIKHLQVAFKTGRKTSKTVLEDVSFNIPRNHTVALVGESGSGKSVTALTVMGLLPSGQTIIDPKSSIIFNGVNLLELSAKERRQLCGSGISMIFQDPMSSLNPVFTVGSQIDEVLMLHKGLTASQARQRTIDLLHEVGIVDPETKVDAYPHELSGGQQQRVMIAMAIACEPQLLIADEPTTALDVSIQKQIMALIRTVQKNRGMSVLFITHDLRLVSEIANDVVVMRYGRIREHNTTEKVFTDPDDAYSKALMLCRPPTDARPWRLPVIEEVMNQTYDENQPQRERGYSGNQSPILDVRHLGKDFYIPTGLFSKRAFTAVKDVSFTLEKGKTLGIVGESGSGKTTVGLTIMRLHQATRGEVYFEGQNISQMSEKQFLPYRKRIQVIFQNPYASLNPRFTTGQILMEPMEIHQIGASREERQAMAFNWLERVGLPADAFYRYPHEFSGGQRQRIAIARCLTLQPDVLLCDESVSALDVSVQAQILNLLQDLQDEFKLSYLFISHDLSVIKYMSDQVLVMKHGEMVELGDTDTVFSHPTQPYTQALLNAVNMR